jgi:hypothetical protein
MAGAHQGRADPVGFFTRAGTGHERFVAALGIAFVILFEIWRDRDSPSIRSMGRESLSTTTHPRGARVACTASVLFPFTQSRRFSGSNRWRPCSSRSPKAEVWQPPTKGATTSTSPVHGRPYAVPSACQKPSPARRASHNRQITAVARAVMRAEQGQQVVEVVAASGCTRADMMHVTGDQSARRALFDRSAGD